MVALVEGLTGDGMAALLDAVLMLNTALLELLLDPAFAGQLAETGAGWVNIGAKYVKRV